MAVCRFVRALASALNSDRLSTRRKLHIESLELRRLLSADAPWLTLDSGPADVDGSSLNGEFSVASRIESSSAGSLYAGEDLGSIEGELRFTEAVGYWDPIDLYRFEVEREADIELDLQPMWSDVDLTLLDSSGNIVGRSDNWGLSRDSITAELASGEYYVAVTSATYWYSPYQLDFSVELAPAAATPGPGGRDSIANIPPLPEVEDFGGPLDWNLNAVGAPEAWAAGYQGEGVTVAVVDSGIDLDHPELTQSLYVNQQEIPGNGIDDDGNGFVDDVNGYDFVDFNATPSDGNGHGTHVAGTIVAANDGRGVTGVAPAAELLPVRVVDDRGIGTADGVASGIRYAADMGADIINLSLGGNYSPLIESAIDYAGSLGSMIVAAAGNSGSSTPTYPARFSETYDHVLSVGAVDRYDNLAGFSNRVGATATKQVDAPGVGIHSTLTDGRLGSLSGTSMASPHVAGVAALTLSANPELSAAELRSLLIAGAKNRANGSDSHGTIDARTSVAYAAAGITLTGNTDDTAGLRTSSVISFPTQASYPVGAWNTTRARVVGLTNRLISVAEPMRSQLASRGDDTDGSLPRPAEAAVHRATDETRQGEFGGSDRLATHSQLRSETAPAKATGSERVDLAIEELSGAIPLGTINSIG